MELTLENVTPYLRSTSCFTFTKSNKYIFKALCARDQRIFYIVKGCGKIGISGTEYPFDRGTVIYIPSGTVYKWRPCGDVKHIPLNFDFTMDFRAAYKSSVPLGIGCTVTPFEADVGFPKTPCLNSPMVLQNRQSLEESFWEITHAFNTRSPSREALASSLLKTVIVKMVISAENTEESGSGSTFLVTELIRFIQTKYEEDLSYEALGEEFNFHPVHLNRIFREETGMTLHGFLVDCRISAAKNLLLCSNMSVSEVAFAVGFTDVPHFVKSFRAHVGKTPADFRRSGSSAPEGTET